MHENDTFSYDSVMHAQTPTLCFQFEYKPKVLNVALFQDDHGVLFQQGLFLFFVLFQQGREVSPRGYPIIPLFYTLSKRTAPYISFA